MIKKKSYLSFKSQVDLFVEKANSRLNILKILTHYNSWKLSRNTLVNIYISLIRSLFEYMGFLFKLLGESQKKEIRAIENNALRIIFFKKRQDCSGKELHEIAKIESLDDRLSKLKNSYFEKAVEAKNRLTELVIKECKEYSKSLMIDESLATTPHELEFKRTENKLISTAQKINPNNIVGSCESMLKYIWDETDPLEENNIDSGIMYSSYNEG